MTHRKSTLLVLGLLVLLIFTPGCGKKNTLEEDEPLPVQQLRQISQMALIRGKGSQPRPKQLSDFKPMEPLYQLGYQALQSGDCIFLWSVYQDAPVDRAATVLAYEKDAPTNGGWAVMADGTVKHLDAEAFQAVPKK